MNHGTAHHAANKAEKKVPIQQCVMRGTCKGPMSAIVALLSQQGAPPLDAFTLASDLGSTVIAGTTSEHVSSRLVPPDPPPPRA